MKYRMAVKDSLRDLLYRLEVHMDKFTDRNAEFFWVQV